MIARSAVSWIGAALALSCAAAAPAHAHYVRICNQEPFELWFIGYHRTQSLFVTQELMSGYGSIDHGECQMVDQGANRTTLAFFRFDKDGEAVPLIYRPASA